LVYTGQINYLFLGRTGTEGHKGVFGHTRPVRCLEVVGQGRYIMSLYPSPVGAHLGTLKGKFARTCAAVVALADTQSTHALMRSCLGPAKVQYAPRNLPLRREGLGGWREEGG